jgi:hypothetical protein
MCRIAPRQIRNGRDHDTALRARFEIRAAHWRYLGSGVLAQARDAAFGTRHMPVKSTPGGWRAFATSRQAIESRALESPVPHGYFIART